MSGLCAAIQLQKKLAITSFTIFEKNADVGGTWLNNTYPGKFNGMRITRDYSWLFERLIKEEMICVNYDGYGYSSSAKRN